jgi:hypothetical protein
VQRLDTSARSALCGFLLACALATGCGSDDGEPRAVATPTITPAATASRSPTATPTLPAPSFTASATFTAAPPTLSATATATTTATATPSATATQTASPTLSPSPTATFVPGTCGDPAVAASEPLCALDAQAIRCDFLIEEACLLPYPSSVFLRSDATSATGYRINFERDAMPANRRDIHIDPTEWNTLDGFSPGPILIALFPEGVDLEASEAPSIDDLPRSLAPDSPTVLIDAMTGERIPHFAELDAQATNSTTQALFIRPAVRLREATRYVVAIRGLRDSSGALIGPRRAFQILRDQLPTPVETINARRQSMEDVFAILADAGVPRTDLQLAWDFVTASTVSLTGRALAIRDQGLAANGPGAPPFTVTSIEDQYSNRIYRRIRGTFTVPLFTRDADPPTVLNLDSAGVPRQNGTTTAPFTVTIPRIAIEGTQPRPGRALVYGHGLLGRGEGEITANNLQTLSNRFNFILAATDWVGLSNADLQPIIRMIPDLSNFRIIPDRLQQAFLNFILLGRLMTAPDGFASHPAFQFDGASIIDGTELYYYGNSQGGIEGGAYLALAPETQRGVLGVGAANYSTLLQRSIAFAPFHLVLNEHYLLDLDRALLYPLIQQLWDRGEPQGYLSHLVADPLPGTPAKRVLMQIGLNDSQVPNLGSEVQARSLGIPSLAPSAWPRFQIPEQAAPFDGSAFVPYDVGGAPVPITNTPPSKENGVHEAVRLLDAAQRQIDAFLRPDGMVQNFCDGACVFRDVPGVDGE